jgi:cysteine synthase A
MSRADEILDQLAQPDRTRVSDRTAKGFDLLAERIVDYPVTPVACYELQVAGRNRLIGFKLEGESPWRSIKGRTAIGLLASVLGRTTDRSTLIESTSGNLGVALSALAGDLDLPFIAVVDDRLPSAMERRMRLAGADLLPADPGPDGMDGLSRRLRTVARLRAADPDALWPDQYGNPVNPLVHRIWTGPELLAQAPQAQALFIGASTGGTLAGVSRAARAARADLKIVGVDVEGSRALGGPHGGRLLSGIGSSRVSEYCDQSTCDAVEVVSSRSGIVHCRAWQRATGLGLGGSGGAVLAAALRHLAAHPELTSVLCLCPDLGENYADTIYDDAWVQAQGIAPDEHGLIKEPPHEYK